MELRVVTAENHGPCEFAASVCAHSMATDWLNLMVSVILSWSKVNEKLLRKRYDHHHRITEWNVVVKNKGLRYCYLLLSRARVCCCFALTL